MALSSGRRTNKHDAVKAAVLSRGLYAVTDAYAGDYDFFAPSALFPDEPDPSDDHSADLQVILDDGAIAWVKRNNT